MSRTRPNILVFMTDQQRHDCLGAMGNPVLRTPHIDALAAGGILFERAYCPEPLCLPARCSLLTGMYPSSHGSTFNGIALREDIPTYAELLRSSGYQTMASGKMHLRPISVGWERPPIEPGEVPDAYPYYGFEQVSFIEGYKSPYLKMIREKAPELWESANHRNPFDRAGPIQTSTSLIPEEWHRSTFVADEAIRLLRERDRAKPFLMNCSFWDPHHPFDPPRPWDEMYRPEDVPRPIARLTEEQFRQLPAVFQTYYTEDGGRGLGKAYHLHTDADWRKLIAHYYGMISLLDKHLGRVVQCLQEEGLYENTAIFFLSDHGELLGDHGFALKGTTGYEALLRVPFLLHFPALLGRPRAVRERIVTHDLMPTILELAGVPVPQTVTGRSLLPLIEGRSPARERILVENDPLGIRTVLKGDYKFNYYYRTGEGEIYHLREDPLELHTLWDNQTLRAELMEDLVRAICLELRPARPNVAPF